MAFPAADRSVLSLHWTLGHGALWLAGVDCCSSSGCSLALLPPPYLSPCRARSCLTSVDCWLHFLLVHYHSNFYVKTTGLIAYTVLSKDSRKTFGWLCHRLVRLPVGNLSLFHAFMFSITVSRLQVSSSSSEESSSRFIHQVSVFHSGGYILLLLTGGMTLSPLGAIRPPSLEDGLLVLFGLVFIPLP